MHRLIILSLACVVLPLGTLVMPALADDAETPAQKAIKEAISILEARQAKAEKKADQDTIADAIAALQKLLPRKAPAGKAPAENGKDTPAGEELKITPALLKKKFQGEASYNAETGVLTLVYDFSREEQLRDFELDDSTPVVSKGTLKLQGGEIMRHRVKFKTVAINTKCANRRGNNHPLIATTEGYAFWIAGNRTALHYKGNDVVENRLPSGNLWTVELKVLEKRISLKAGAIELGKAITVEMAGQVELKGGEKGNIFSKVVIEGKVDKEWAQQFFAP
jgi:hypothetical protein